MSKNYSPEKYFDIVSSNYDSTERQEGSIIDIREKEILAKFLNIHKRKIRHALDLGCGTGRITAFLHSLGIPQVTGIDISRKMVEIARKKFSKLRRNLHFVAADAESFVTRGHGQKFDFIVFLEVLEFLNNPKQFLSNVAKMLPKGSLVYFDYVNKMSLPVIMRFGNKAVIKNFYDFQAIEKICNVASIKIVHSEGIFFFPGPKSILENNRFLKSLWLPIERLLANLPLIKHLLPYRVDIVGIIV